MPTNEDGYTNPSWERIDKIYDEMAGIFNKYREESIKDKDPLTFPEVDLVLWKLKLFRDQQFLELYLQHTGILATDKTQDITDIYK